MRISCLVICTLLLVGAELQGAVADEFLGRKPGIWEITISFVVPEASSQTAAICLDADFAKDLAKGLICESQNIQRSANTVRLHSVCTIEAHKLFTDAVVTFKGETAYHVDIKERVEPPSRGVGEATIAQDAKWLGPCLKGMKPGDTAGADDRKQ